MPKTGLVRYSDYDKVIWGLDKYKIRNRLKAGPPFEWSKQINLSVKEIIIFQIVPVCGQ
jgi:hypothetical protein